MAEIDMERLKKEMEYKPGAVFNEDPQRIMQESCRPQRIFLIHRLNELVDALYDALHCLRPEDLNVKQIHTWIREAEEHCRKLRTLREGE